MVFKKVTYMKKSPLIEGSYIFRGPRLYGPYHYSRKINCNDFEDRAYAINGNIISGRWQSLKLTHE